MEIVRIPTTYGKLNLYRKGNGLRTILLLHGGGCDSAMLSWREVMQEFCEDYTVYAPDLLGYGASDKPDDICGAQFYDKHIGSIRELVEYLELEHFALAGLSMGGAIAIGYALKYPEQVQCLFPVTSWGVSRKLPMHRFSNWYIHRTNFTVIQYNWLAKVRWLAKWSVNYALIGNKRFVTDALLDEVIEACSGSMAGKSMQDFQRSSSRKEGAYPYYAERLKELQMPVVFINGEKDPLVPLKHTKEAAAYVPHGEVHVMKGCKHWAVKERPREFYEIVNRSIK